MSVGEIFLKHINCKKISDVWVVTDGERAIIPSSLIDHLHLESNSLVPP